MVLYKKPVKIKHIKKQVEHLFIRAIDLECFKVGKKHDLAKENHIVEKNKIYTYLILHIYFTITNILF